MNIKVPTEENLRKQENFEASQKMQKALIRCHVWHSCLNCEYWYDKPAQPDGTRPYTGCMKFKAKPPPEVIVYGCVEWEDAIPF